MAAALLTDSLWRPRLLVHRLETRPQRRALPLGKFATPELKALLTGAGMHRMATTGDFAAGTQRAAEACARVISQQGLPLGYNTHRRQEIGPHLGRQCAQHGHGHFTHILACVDDRVRICCWATYQVENAGLGYQRLAATLSGNFDFVSARTILHCLALQVQRTSQLETLGGLLKETLARYLCM